MMDAFVKRWGKAAALAFFTAAFSTFVMLAILLLVRFDKIPGATIGDVAWAYFTAMGLIGGGSQLPNVAERLPGERKWHSPHAFDGQQRRASDVLEDK